MWLMRLGYQTGRHIVGADLLQVRSATDYLLSQPAVDPSQIAVAGHGQGGMTSLLAAALDTRLKVAWTSGYLDDSRPEWEQPEDRMLWKLRRLFLSNSQIMALVSPRTLLSGSTLDDAALTRLRDTRVPCRRADSHKWQHPRWISKKFPRSQTRSSASGKLCFAILLWKLPTSYKFVGSLIIRHPRCMSDRWLTSAKRIGTWSVIMRRPMATWTRKVFACTMSRDFLGGGYRSGLRRCSRLWNPAGSEGNETGEKRPVVFVQHGLAGRPESSLGVVPSEHDDAVYSRFGLRLVERGYIVFAPMIATQDNVERTKLIRRAHPVGMIPAGMDVKKFGRVLDYLTSLPYVDAKRFALYGLSYGGYTALWVGPGEPRFQAVI